MIPTTSIILKQYQDDGSIKQLELPNCLIDTGACETYINRKVVPDCMEISRLDEPDIVSNAFKEQISTVHNVLHANIFIVNSNIEIPNVTLNLLEEPMKYNVILGMNCLSYFKIDFRHHKLKFINNIFKKKQRCRFDNNF